MRIAFLVDVFPSLSETFILSQITGLRDLGQEVEIFAGMRPVSPLVHPEVEAYGLLKHTHYIHDLPSGRVNRAASAARHFGPLLRSSPRALLRSLNVMRYGAEALSLRLFFRLKPSPRHPLSGRGTAPACRCQSGLRIERWAGQLIGGCSRRNPPRQ